MRAQHAFITCFGLLAFGLVAARADGLSEFQTQVNRCSQAFAARPSTQVVFAEAAKSWVKREYAAARVTYDVKKTDSLVSPLTGSIEITDAMAVLRATDEHNASMLKPSLAGREGGSSVTRLNFAYQSGRWVFVNGRITHKTNIPLSKPSAFELKATDLAELAEPGRSTAECMPKP